MVSLRIACLIIHLIARGASGYRIRKASALSDSEAFLPKGTGATATEVDNFAQRDLQDALRYWKVDSSGFDYDKVRRMKGSEVWRLVEKGEEALGKLKDRIKTRSAKIQEEKKAVNAALETARSQIKANRKKYESAKSEIKAERDDANDLRKDIRRMKAEILKVNIVDLKMSELGKMVEAKRIMESMEGKWKHADDRIKSRWAAVQKNRISFEKDWQDALAHIKTRRDAYKAELKMIDTRRARAKKHSDVIRKLRKIALNK